MSGKQQQEANQKVRLGKKSSHLNMLTGIHATRCKQQQLHFACTW
jgi:hypothetical protein